MIICRMPKICAIPQILLVLAPYPIPIVEHVRGSHPQCEKSYWKVIWVGKQPKENVKLCVK